MVCIVSTGSVLYQLDLSCGSVLPQPGVYCPRWVRTAPRGSWQRWVCSVSGGSAVGFVTSGIPSFQVGLCCLEIRSLVSQVALFCPRWVCTVPGGSALSSNGSKVVSILELVCDVPKGSITSRVGLYCLENGSVQDRVCTGSSMPVISLVGLY